MPEMSAVDPKEERTQCMLLCWAMPESFGLDIRMCEVQFQVAIRGDHWDAQNQPPSPLYIQRDNDSKIAKFLESEIAAQNAVPVVETTPVFGPPYGFTQRQNKLQEDQQRRNARTARLLAAGRDMNGNKAAIVKLATASTRILHSGKSSAFKTEGETEITFADFEDTVEIEVAGKEEDEHFPPGPSNNATNSGSGTSTNTGICAVAAPLPSIMRANSDNMADSDTEKNPVHVPVPVPVPVPVSSLVRSKEPRKSVVGGPDTVLCGGWTTIYRYVCVCTGVENVTLGFCLLPFGRLKRRCVPG
jgi:hypothetical protein